MRVDSILETIGHTPSVLLQKLAPKHVQLYVKLEAANPSASSKDRIALGIIDYAEQTGQLHPGQTIVEATSGNFGIALAMVCAQRGYPLVAVMPEYFSIERRKLMRFYGANVVLTPADQLGSGAVVKARELADKRNWFHIDQFDNEMNAKVHAQTTAREILHDFRDLPLDYWVTGYGSGGTLKGVADMLKLRSPRTRVIVCEPNNAQLLANADRQLRLDNGRAVGSHPDYRPHLMQGWTLDFVPKLAGDAYDAGFIDGLIPVENKNALHNAHMLAEHEGILTGTAGGAALYAALQVARRAPQGSTLLCMLPDTGERYLSTALFQDIETDMNEGERSISESTPSARFEINTPPLPTIEVQEQEPLITEITTELIQQMTSNPKTPVVLFALEWCEFCWAVRRLFTEMSIPFHAVDLDSAGYHACDLGKKLKATLFAQTGTNTLPQVFIGGEYIGGCMELFDDLVNRSLFKKLNAAGVTYNKVVDIDPYTLLPGWMHEREDMTETTSPEPDAPPQTESAITKTLEEA